MNVIADIVPEFMHFNFVDSANLILLLGFILILGAIGGRLFQKLKIPHINYILLLLGANVNIVNSSFLRKWQAKYNISMPRHLVKLQQKKSGRN